MAKDKGAEAASTLAQLRWKGKTDKDKKKFMAKVRALRTNAPGGRKGGRKRLAERCYCGENSWTRATARAFGCCKRAGKFPKLSPKLN